MTLRAHLIALTLATALPLLCSACTGSVAPADELTSWSIDSVPLLEISDDDPGGAVVLGAAVHVTRLPDGGVLVTDRGLHSIRFFAPDGRFVRAVGRRGSGPGEFEYIRVAYRCGDSLYVEENAARRVMLHALDGSLARTMTTSEFGGGTDAFRSACNNDGVFVHLAWGARFDPSKRGRLREPVAVWLTSADGARVAALDDVGGQEFIGFAEGAFRALLRRTPHVAIGGRQVYVGSGDSSVQVYTLDGAPAGVRTLPPRDLRVSDADLERAKRLDSLGEDAETQAETRRIWELDTPPATLPAYDALIVDSEDHLWVRRHPVAGQERTPWIVFDPDGAHVATVELPGVLTVHEIGVDYIAGIVLDPETGTHSVRVIALTRASPR